MESLIQTLSWVSSAMQVPVVIAILYLLVRGLLAVGRCYGTWSDRMRFQRALPATLHALDARQLAHVVGAMPARARSGLPAALSALLKAPYNGAWHERVLAQFEVAADRQLSPLRTMTRIGPLLGLMGTLIPLGPALVGLAAGDISLLARKMEVAFSTTVVGLVIGALGFLLHQAQNRWLRDDLSLLEFASQSLQADAQPAQALGGQGDVTDALPAAITAGAFARGKASAPVAQGAP